MRGRRLLVEALLLVATALFLAVGLRAGVAEAFRIPSASMIPQLDVGDRVVVSKLAYDLHDPRRGDVVVFDAPPNAVGAKKPEHRSLPARVVREVLQSIGAVQPSTEEYIKRVVALPGESV